MRSVGGAAFAAAALAAVTAHAAGFEKVTTWSGRHTGLAGLTSPYVDGAQSLAFNPAGLARPEGWITGWADNPTGFDVSLNFSPTLSQFKGPISSPTQLDGEWTFSPVFGALASVRPAERLGIGVGIFLTGGTRAEYEDVDFSGLNPNFDELRPTVSAELSLIEASLGAGFEIVPGLRIGAAWRLSIVGAELESATPVPAPAGAPPGTPPVALIAASLEDLSDTQFDGFRVGIQYAQKSGLWGAGVHWRSPVGFNAEGDVSGQLEGGVGANGPVAPVPGGDATASAQFPSQIVAGAFFAPTGTPDLRLFAEYAFTHYSVVDAIELDGTLQTPTGPVPVPDITTNWDDQHNIRAGIEWLPVDDLALRAGYAFTSRVTNPDFARATLASPGIGNSVTLGAGTRMLGGKLLLNAALEASWASGNGTNELGFQGEFESLGLVAHLGATLSM